MIAVKGSKQYQMQVVPFRPVYTAAMWVLVTSLIVALVMGSYYLGNSKGRVQQKQAVAERDALLLEVAAKTKEIESLRQDVANLRLGAQVDRQASEGVRGEVIELKAQIAELQADISFYRGLMSPTANKRGLTIGSLNVISTGVPRRYEYKLVVQQLAINHQILTGVLNFNVVGRQGDLIKTIPLKELSAQVKTENIKLRFKYFQGLEGELMLPPDFEPERIELLARSTGRNSATVEKKFGWLVQEG